MKAFISFSEILSLIQLKTKQKIAFTAISGQTLKVETKLSIKLPILGEIGKVVALEVTVERIAGTDIYLKYDGGLGIDQIIKGFITFVSATSSQQVIDKMQDNGLVVHLDRIEQAEKALQLTEPTQITFESEGIAVEARLKLNEM